MRKAIHRIPRILIINVLAFSLLSCDALMNPESVFASMDKPDTAAISRETGTSLIDILMGMEGSDAFYGSLSDEEIARITASLNAIINDPAYSATDRANAALMLAELSLLTNDSANDTVNGLADAVMNAEDYANEEGLGALIGMLTGSIEGIADDEVALEAFLADMLTISAAYEDIAALGAGDIDLGDIQIYATAAVFASVVELYEAAGSTDALSEAAHALSLALTADPAVPFDYATLIPAGSTEEDLETIIRGADGAADDALGKITTLIELAELAGVPSAADPLREAFGVASGT